ncbi:MAG: hypothetical protein IPO67_19120 [Deltaproteobacteria bacterium]|nr:hypothetical protein [Deltaproteobacteria bacterium]
MIFLWALAALGAAETPCDTTPAHDPIAQRDGTTLSLSPMPGGTPMTALRLVDDTGRELDSLAAPFSVRFGAPVDTRGALLVREDGSLTRWERHADFLTPLPLAPGPVSVMAWAGADVAIGYLDGRVLIIDPWTAQVQLVGASHPGPVLNLVSRQGALEALHDAPFGAGPDGTTAFGALVSTDLSSGQRALDLPMWSSQLTWIGPQAPGSAHSLARRVMSPGWPYVPEPTSDCVGSPPEGWRLAPPPVQVKARVRRGELRLRGKLTPTGWGAPTGLTVAVAEAPGYWRFVPLGVPEGATLEESVTVGDAQDLRLLVELPDGWLWVVSL